MAKAKDTVYLIQEQNGLNLQFDPLERPEGSLLRGSNIWANREGMLESRRGLGRYGGGVLDQLHQWEFEGDLTDSVGSMTLTPLAVPTYAAGGIVGQKVDGGHFLNTGYGAFPLDWTIAIWIQYDHNPVAGHYPTRMTGPAPALTFGLYGAGATPPNNTLFWSSTGAGWTSNVYLGPRILNQWCLVVFGYDDSAGQWFVSVDGGAKTWTVDTMNRNPLHTWMMSYPAGHVWIDETSFFDRVIADSEITYMWNGGAGNRPNVGNAFKPITAQFEYKDSLVRHTEGGILQYDSGGGAFVRYSDRHDPPVDQKMRNVESRKSDYITTNLGVYKHDELATNPTRAGIEPFLELTLGFTGTGLGHLLANSRTGYRGVWYREDANDKQLWGAPSWAEWLANPWINSAYAWVGPAPGVVTVTTTANHGYTTGDTVQISLISEPNISGAFVITVTAPTTFTYVPVGAPGAPAGSLNQAKNYSATIDFPIPDDVVAGDYYEIYRTEPSADATIQPTEEYFLVEQVEVTAGDIATGTIAYTDTIAAGLLDTDKRLYTNPSQGTIQKANDRPPLAADITLFKGHMIFANVFWEEEIDFQMRDTTGIVAGVSTVVVGAETYTFAAAESVALKQFQLYTTLTLAQNLASTMKSFVRIVNRASAIYYAFYISGATGSPGKVLVRHRACGSAAFSVTCNNAATSVAFMPHLPTSGTSLSSEAPGGANVVALSKFEQADAVPRTSTKPLGAEDNQVLRCLALRDSCLFFKDLGGAWVMSGETDGGVGDDFSFKVRDESLRIYGAATARVMSNRVFLYSNEGFVAMDENGAEIIGRAIEEETERIKALTNWNELAFGVPYDSEDMYLCFGPWEAGDTYPTYCWAYNDITEKWVHGYVKPISAGHNLSIDDKLYLAHAVDHYTLQERKSLNDDSRDYRDEEIDVTINVASTTVNDDGITVSLLDVTYDYATVPLGQGFQIAQGSWFTEVMEVTALGGTSYRLECAESVPFTTGAASVFIPIYVDIKFSDAFGSNASLLKQLMNVQFEFEDDRAFSHFVGFATDYIPTEEYNTIPYSTAASNAGFGLSFWGPSPWGDPGDRSKTPITVTPPPDYARFRRLNVCYKHNVAGEKVALCQVTLRMREISLRGRAKNPRN